MIRIYLTIIFLLFFQLTINAQTMKAGIKYNEASARIEAFKDVEEKIEKDFYSKYKKDINRDLNISLIKSNIFEVKDNRELCPFYIKNTFASYAITYKENPNYVFYYNILGNLIKFDIVKKDSYPRKVIGYSRYGNLISASIEVDENEQFVYDENGKLIAHWLDDVVLNKNSKTPKFIQLRRGGNFSK